MLGTFSSVSRFPERVLKKSKPKDEFQRDKCIGKFKKVKSKGAVSENVARNVISECSKFSYKKKTDHVDDPKRTITNVLMITSS